VKKLKNKKTKDEILSIAELEFQKCFNAVVED
jgi:hypothetical protein